MKRCALGNAAACCIGEAVARHAVVTQAPAFVKQAPQEDSAVAKGVRLTEERLPDSRVRVTVEVPVQDVRTAYERGLQLARKRLELPGFRKGKKASSHSLFIYFASTLVPLCDIGSQEGAASLPQVALGLMTAAITHGCMRRAHGCAAALRQATLCAWVQRVPGMRRCQSPCLVRHLGGQAEANGTAIELLLKATVPTARPPCSQAPAQPDALATCKLHPPLDSLL